MNGFFRQKHGLVLLCGIVIAMGLIYWFGIRKMLSIIRMERDDIQKMIVIRENRDHQMGRLEEYGVQYARIMDIENQLTVFMVRENMIEFIRRLESLAEEGGVAVILEVREAPKVLKKEKVVVSSKKTDQEEEHRDESVESTSAKAEKKARSIIESLPSTTYTYLGLQVTGETGRVMKYLHKVETLPIALDIISIGALRVENPLFLEKAGSQSISVPKEVTPETVSDEGSPVSEETPSETKPAVNPSEVRVTASLVVYHPKK